MTELSKSEITSAAEFAHYYRGLGLQAVPARMPSEGVDWKRPALSTWKEHSGALVDDTIFTVWYGLNGKHLNRPNLGLITGSASGRVFVLDADTHKHPEAQHWLDGVLALHNNGAMFETPTQRTGGGGFQYLFRAPPDWSPPTCKTPIGIDVRGEGGFAMLPPSIHETGEYYAWMSGKEPWEVAIMDAPQWLCDEIDKLLTKSSGKSTKELSTSGDNKESHKHVKNASGKLTDGREDYMKSLIWARIVALYRESPIRPVTEILKAECQKAFDVYLQKVTTNIEKAGTPIKSLLERENRGWTEFELKWVYAMDQWDSDVAMAVKNEQPPECPRPLMRELPSPEPFPVDAMGELLGSAAKAIHDKVQAALAICCQSVLANATLCIQGHADVLLPMGHARPLSCYFVTVAATGERKSASDHESCGATVSAGAIIPH